MWRAILCSLLVVLAGCAVDLNDPLQDQSRTASPTTVPATNVTERGPTEATARSAELAVVDADNPWGERTLTVAIATAANDTRHYEPLVAEALAYWEANADTYAGYPIRFDLEPNATNPDLVVSFVDAVRECNNVTDAAGCAPYVTEPGLVERPERIEIKRGYDDNSTVLVIKHEFGHALGLDHDDDPQSVMTTRTTLIRLPQPDAASRSFAWSDANFTVFLDTSNASNPDVVAAQVDHALDFYERGANGTVPENVSFSYVDNRTRADVIISFPETLPCAEGRGSCGSRFGVDPDDDGALETYTRLTISVHDVDENAVGWHVGYWLGFGLGFDDPGEWPVAFRDASYDDRRSEWWR